MLDQPLAEEDRLVAARARDRCRTASCWSAARRRRCATFGMRYGPLKNCASVARRDQRRWCGHRRRGRRTPRRAEPRIVPSRVAGDLDLAIHLARVVHRDQVLAPVLDPAHRAADMPRGERDQEILGIELAARAEAAADIVLDQIDMRPAAGPASPRGCRRLKNGTLAAPRRSCSPAAASHSASTPRGSIGSAVWRCARKRSRRT